MNINPITMRNIYKANAAAGASEARVEAQTSVSAGSEKMDTVSISAAATAQRDVARVTKGIMGDIEKLNDPARVEEIKTRVQNHTYFVSTDELADTILGWAV